MMFVDYTGEVIICSHDWGKRFIAGNLNKDSILEIWTGGSLCSILDTGLVMLTEIFVRVMLAMLRHTYWCRPLPEVEKYYKRVVIEGVK